MKCALNFSFAADGDVVPVAFEGARFAKAVSAFGTSKFALDGSRVDLDLKPMAVSMIRFPID